MGKQERACSGVIVVVEDDRSAGIGGKRNSVQHFQDAQCVIAGYAWRAGLTNGVCKFAELGDAAAVERWWVWRELVRRPETRVSSRAHGEAVVGSPLGAAPSIGANRLHIVVHVIGGRGAIEVGGQAAF